MIILKYPKYSLFILLPFIWLSCSQNNKNQFTDDTRNWAAYLGDNSSSQYSALTEITKENVTQLTVAWEYNTGDNVSKNQTQIQCNPLVIDGILYGTSPTLKVFALNAATGERIWEYNPNEEADFAMNVNRGVTYWQEGTDRRILFTAGPNLYALNAENGLLITSFGNNGMVSLKEGLGENAADKYVVATSPGIVYGDIYIVGSRVSENIGAAPGHIRAFNVKTGKLEWVFHTIPQPGEFGYETWPADAWQRTGGANAWAGMSLDKNRGIVYIPTGSATFDFWGGDRLGTNLFANCVLALDAKTGQRKWHFQTVRHDIWDRDLSAPPNLVTVVHGGKKIDAVAQITKAGQVFLLDRETGIPLFPVEEKPFPASDLYGEETWPTQPIPVKPPPFSPGLLTMDIITDISQESHDYATEILKNVRTGGQYIPPSTEGTVIFPGFDGGGEWGGAAFDPESRILYVNSSIMPWILTMKEIDAGPVAQAAPGKRIYEINCAICHGQNGQGMPEANYPSLQNIQNKLTKAEMLDVIEAGRGFMPGFAFLKNEDKELVIDYISSATSDVTRHSTGQDNRSSSIPYTFTGYNRFLDPEGYPAVKPPWGNLSAIDLDEGTILWQVPLGEFEELTERGIPITGTENYGGPAVTAGGIIFIGASKDEYFRAFDKETGKELWKHKLPAGAYATPSVYEADGKQYVVIACGGGKMGTPSGNSYVAFTLK